MKDDLAPKLQDLLPDNDLGNDPELWGAVRAATPAMTNAQGHTSVTSLIPDDIWTKLASWIGKFATEIVKRILSGFSATPQPSAGQMMSPDPMTAAAPESTASPVALASIIPPDAWTALLNALGPIITALVKALLAKLLVSPPLSAN